MAYRIGPTCIGCGACIRACPVTAISGERGAMHVIDPARCIECGACGRLCPKTAVSDEQGRGIDRLLPRSRWPKPSFALARCISCGACAEHCPAGCIEMSDGKPGGLESWPRLARPEACVACAYCAFYCPMSCVVVTLPLSETECNATPPPECAKEPRT